jgi:hypothetical protein
LALPFCIGGSHGATPALGWPSHFVLEGRVGATPLIGLRLTLPFVLEGRIGGMLCVLFDVCCASLGLVCLLCTSVWRCSWYNWWLAPDLR